MRNLIVPKGRTVIHAPSRQGNSFAVFDIFIILFLGVVLLGIFSFNTYGETNFSGKIWIAGDSIAADHSYENELDYAVFVHGWGEVIGDYMTEDVVVYNKAISGQSAKYFVEEDNYKDIMSGIGEGDFLLIQFGHNDYKSAGTNHYSLPTTTEGSYKWYLKNYYIDPALKAGAFPVLCTSVVCCNFNDGTVYEEQAQGLFAGAMRELYNEYKSQGIEIGLIDTYELTQTMLNYYSSSAASFYALKYDRGGSGSTSLDHVHFSLKGANMAADMIAENLFVMYPDFNRYNPQQIVDGGEGTEENPFLISSFSQLYRILQDNTKNTEDIYYKMTKDFEPVIQNKEGVGVFRANLDGDGHTMKNAAGRATKCVFDKNYGSISNLNIDYSMEHSCEDIQYPFVNENYGLINNCSASGNIWYDCFLTEKEKWYCGMFAGINHKGGEIINCRSSIKVSLNADTPITYLGGIAGKNEGVISKCENTGKLRLDLTEYYMQTDTLHKTVHCVSGGIAGVSGNDANISDCACTVKPTVLNVLKGETLYVLNDYLFVNESKINEIIYVMGDVDFDGEVTLVDTISVLKFALKIMQPDSREVKAADMDCDGKIMMNDVVVVLKTALKLVSCIIY